MIHKTVREIAGAWKEYKRPYVKQSTMAAYVLILENHVLPYFGDNDSLHEQAVQTFVLQKLESGLSVIGNEKYIIFGKMEYIRISNNDTSFSVTMVHRFR